MLEDTRDTIPCQNTIRSVKAHLYLLIYSMVQSTSWEASWFAASQEIPRISRNPKVHYRTHKRPPPVSILGQPNPVHIPTSHLLEIHPNIIHPSTPRSPQWSLSLRFPQQDPIHPPLLTHTRHMPRKAHLLRYKFVTRPSCMLLLQHAYYILDLLVLPSIAFKPLLSTWLSHAQSTWFYNLTTLL